MAVPSTGLRVREIVFAVAMGGLAAGGAALMLNADKASAPSASAVAVPDHLTYNVAPFEEISSIGPQDVIVTYGERFSVRSEGVPEALALMDAAVDDGKLVIRQKAPFENGPNLQSAREFSQGMRQLSSVTFHVTVPRLRAFSLVGTGDAEIDRIEVERFEASIRGAGELSIASMQVDEADLSIAGRGSVDAAGTAGDTRVSVAGSGELDARDLRSKTAWVSMAGSGEASLTVEDEAQVSLKGSGDVDISGPARCTVSRMGSGDVRCSGDGD